MKYVKVKDLGQIITGNTPPTTDEANYGDFMPFIKATDIPLGSRFTYVTEQCYSEKSYNRYKANLVPKGSTCIVTIGSIGKKMTQAHTDLFVNQAINAIIPNEQYDEDYVYYVTRYAVLPQLKIYDSGTTSGRENISKSSFSNIRLLVEENKRVQQKIASILSTYDTLIENNTKRIRLLEQMAENLYKEWFVRFRFPGHENVEMENGLPKGWKNCSIAEYAEIMSGGTPKTDNESYYGGDIPFFTPKDARDSIFSHHTLTNITEEGLNHCNSKLYPKGTVTITARGTVGRVNMMGCSMAMNQSCFALKSKNHKNNIFLFFALRDASALMKKMANGGVFDTIILKTFEHIPMLIPPEDTINAFDALINPILDSLFSLEHQTTLLTRQRDLLLPRLMSGKLEVTV